MIAMNPRARLPMALSALLMLAGASLLCWLLWGCASAHTKIDASTAEATETTTTTIIIGGKQ